MELIKNIMLALFMMPAWAMAQKYTYPAELYRASTIPDSLKSHANSVIRFAEKNYEIKSISRVTQSCSNLITLLNPEAEDELSFAFAYDKFRSVNDIDIKVYDSEGVLDRKYSKKDFLDITGDWGSTLISDNRYLRFKVAVPSYPATLEISYKITDNGLIDYEDWYPQDTEQSIQQINFTVSLPKEQTLRFKSARLKEKPLVTEAEGLKKYAWSVKNLKAFKYEKGSVSWDIYPMVNISPADFEIDNIKGNLSTWEDFGRFYYGLASKQLDLSPQRQQEIRDMTAGLKTDREKIDFLYRYMQQNMRYVSIQLGIGGWKPLPASFVDSKKYGDCKALTNYMQALLQAVDIKSYHALINAGENGERADREFANNKFNHVILVVPQPKDSVWLECTSTTAIPGELGTFTENRNALLVKPEGSYLQSTPPSKASANTLQVTSDVQLSEDGSAKVKLLLSGRGEYRDDMIYNFAREKTDEQQRWLLHNLGLKQADQYSIKHAEDKNGLKEAAVELEYSKLSEFSAGTKQFYRSSLQKLWNLSLPENENRRTDYYLNCPLIKSDKTIYHLPAGFEPENLPAKMEKRSASGTYRSEFVYDKENNTVISTAEINVPNQKISINQYNAAKTFFDEVIKAESRRIIIRKKTT